MTGIVILHVLHASEVAAISTAAGPARLLEAGLERALATGGLPVEVTEVVAPRSGSRGAVAASFAIADRIADEVRQARSRNELVVVLSGSCQTAVGSVAGMASLDRGVIWLDCHGDFNTPDTTQSGLLDGMTLASVTGRCWRTMCARVSGFSPVADENVVLIGVRDLDEGEASLLAESEIVAVSGADAALRGADAVTALGDRASSVYLHVDLDVLDPSVGRANAFVTAGGVNGEELRDLLESSFSHCPIGVVSFTSYDPEEDETGGVCQAALEAATVIGRVALDAESSS